MVVSWRACRPCTQLRGILSRPRWFFVQVAGRRRIGKISLIQQALKQTRRDLTLYIQIPDSEPTGVLEELAGRLYEEASRKGLGDFPLSERIKGYWDRAGVEIDLVAVSEPTRRIRFGTCKRNPVKLIGSLSGLRAGAQAFLRHHRTYVDWQVEYCAIAPNIRAEIQSALQR